jgi:hypothetical protein
MPLETLIEREAIRPATDQTAEPAKLQLAAEAGQQFLRMLDQQSLSRDYRDTFIHAYPFPAVTTEQRSILDSDSRGFCDVMASRVPDGRQLSAAFRSTGAGGMVIAPALQIAPADLAAVETTARLWLQWYETLCVVAYVSACLCARERVHEPSVESVFPAPGAAQGFGEPTH